MTYGINVQEGEDPFINLIENANQNFNAATIPGAFLVDFFPSLKLLPEWLPGMGFMDTARTWAKMTAEMVEVPYAFTKQSMVKYTRAYILHWLTEVFQVSGSAPSSFVAELLEDEASLSTEQISEVKFAASSMYGGK